MKIIRKPVRIKNPRRSRSFPVRVVIQIPETNLEQAIQSVHDWYGVHLRTTQLLRIAAGSGSLAMDLAHLPTDTETREAIASEVGKLVTGRRWPTFGDGPRVWTRFAKTFNRLAARRGIRITRALDTNPPKPRAKRMTRCLNAVPSTNARKTA